MNPFLIGGVALGLYLYSQSKKTPKAPHGGSGNSGGAHVPGSGGGSGGNAGGGRIPTTPTGPFDPFNLPDIDPPDQGGGGAGGGEGDSGRGGSGERTDDPAPIPVPPGTTLEDIGPYTLAITFDCQEILEGEFWFDEVFYPACARLVELDGETFDHPWVLMRALLLTAEDASCPPDAPECNLEPGCILNWTYFLGPILDVPGGEWDSSTNEGYAAFLSYSDWYGQNYAAVDAFLQSVESRLWYTDLAAHFNLHVNDAIVFVPPGEVA